MAGQRLVALQRDPALVLGIEERLPGVRWVGDLLGVDDQALRPGLQRDEHHLALRVANALRVAERQVRPAAHALRLDRAQQIARRERVHLVGADLDHVGLEAGGELRRGLGVAVEGGRLDVEVRVLGLEPVEECRGDRVVVGEGLQAAADRSIGVLRSGRRVGIALTAAAGHHDTGKEAGERRGPHAALTSAPDGSGAVPEPITIAVLGGPPDHQLGSRIERGQRAVVVQRVDHQRVARLELDVQLSHGAEVDLLGKLAAQAAAVGGGRRVQLHLLGSHHERQLGADGRAVVGRRRRIPSPRSIATRPPSRRSTRIAIELETPMKSATKVSRGARRATRGSVDLLDPAAVHHRDPVRHRQRLLLVVRDVDEGRPGLDFWIRLSSSCISLRSFRSSAPSGSSSSSAAGRLTSARASATRWRWPPESWPGRRSPRPSSRIEVEHLGDPRRCDLALCDALQLQPEADVLGNRHVREERVVLEDHVHVALRRRHVRDVLALEQDPALCRVLEAGDHPQRRRLAAAARAEQREELAGGDLERDGIRGLRRPRTASSPRRG